MVEVQSPSWAPLQAQARSCAPARLAAGAWLPPAASAQAQACSDLDEVPESESVTCSMATAKQQLTPCAVHRGSQAWHANRIGIMKEIHDYAVQKTCRGLLDDVQHQGPVASSAVTCESS